MSNNKVHVFYRIVKAQRGHPFSGLYAVEKVFIRNEAIYKRVIAHEWDLRILAEAALAKLGGSSAFEAFREEHPDLEDELLAQTETVPARTAADLTDLTPRKLNKELKLAPEKD